MPKVATWYRTEAVYWTCGKVDDASGGKRNGWTE